ncbi:MAG: cystathionine beta-lyase [Pseudomonadota bacterium]
MTDTPDRPAHAPHARAPQTQLAHTGRGQDAHYGFVNVPPFRGSTTLYRSFDALLAGDAPYKYGRRGTPTSQALEGAICALEQGADTVLVPSGLAAVAGALLAFLDSGDHALIADSVYGPTRSVCEDELRRFGISVTYYDPLLQPHDVLALATERTRILYCESPGSQTFEMQDIPALADLARQRGILTMVDNTWASPLYCKPIALGADVSIQAGTKYIVGHADAMLGAVTANAACADRLRARIQGMGLCAGSEETYLGMRGMRTLAVRLAQHHASAVQIARWLQARPEVDRVMFPALEDDPGYALWQRDMSGASGLFAVVLKSHDRAHVAAFCDSLTLFGMGFSWGSYESLIVPFFPGKLRTASPWPRPGQNDGFCLRLHIGLEAPEDLIADMDAAFSTSGLHHAATT